MFSELWQDFKRKTLVYFLLFGSLWAIIKIFAYLSKENCTPGFKVLETSGLCEKVRETQRDCTARHIILCDTLPPTAKIISPNERETRSLKGSP